MNNEDFKVVVDGCIENIKQVLESKSQEYSSKEDKLHNFVAAAKLMRCKSKEYALLGMLNKHLVSVIDMIVKYEQEGILPSAKLVNEKIGDSINYFVLLKACFMEDVYNKENDKMSNYTVGDIRNIRERIKKIDEGNLCEFCANADRNCLIKENLGMKIAECKAFIDLKKQQVAMINSNNDKQDIETLKKKEALIANSLWNNPRKKMIVDIAREKLKPIFVYLTENNMFREYEIIKGICNREEMKQDDIGDNEFYKNIVIALEKLQSEFSADMRSVSDEIISRFAQGLSKFNVGDMVICIAPLAWNNKWEVCEWWRIQRIGVGIENGEIYYYSKSSVGTKEKDCFATKEEAEKECERRNKEIEKGSAKE